MQQPKRLKDLSKNEYKRILERSTSKVEEALSAVIPIIKEVKENGDEALVKFTAGFDKVNLTAQDFIVSKERIEAAYKKTSPDVVASFKRMRDQVCHFHQHQIRKEWSINKFADKGEGRYGVAVGYVETFTLIEWLMIPLDVISIHQWEGQSLSSIFAPMALTLGIGLLLIFWKIKPTSSVAVFLGVLSGLLYIGSGLMMLIQMLIALIGAASTSSLVLTLVFSTLPVFLGFLILRKIVNYDIPWRKRDRVIFAVFGILGYALWAGFLLGPSLIIIASILPETLFP